MSKFFGFSKTRRKSSLGEEKDKGEGNERGEKGNDENLAGRDWMEGILKKEGDVK